MKLKLNVRQKLTGSFLALTLLLSLFVSIASYLITHQFVRTRVSESFSITLDYVSSAVETQIDTIYSTLDYIFVNGNAKEFIFNYDKEISESIVAGYELRSELTDYSSSHMFNDINCITIQGFNGAEFNYAINYADLASAGLFDNILQFKDYLISQNGQIGYCGVSERPQSPSNDVVFKDIIFARVIKDISYQNDIGVVGISVNPRAFTNIVMQFNDSYTSFGNEFNIFIVDDYGDIVNQTDVEIDSEIFLNYLSNPEAKKSTGFTDGNLNQVVYVKPVQNSGFNVVATIPLSLLTSDNSYILQITIIAFLLTVSICSLIGVYINKSISKPLSEAAATVSKIAEGETSLRIAVTQQDEIGQLADNINYMLEQIKILNKNALQKELAIKDAMYQAKQAQISPHFMYNTLNSIRWMAIAIKAEDIKNALDAFWKITKYNSVTDTYFVTVEQEIDIINQYAYLQSLSYVDKFKIVWFVSDDVLNYKCLKFILQPLVENAIVHGVFPKEECGEIYISIYTEQDRLVINVYDNGVGMSESTIKDIQSNKNSSDGSHIGVPNVLSRLQLIYNDKHSIEIESEQNVYTSITIRTPLEL